MIAVPVIDTIDEHSFEYKKSGQSQLYKGGFDWGLNFQWIERNELGESDEPFLTPAMTRVTTESVAFNEILDWINDMR